MAQRDESGQGDELEIQYWLTLLRDGSRRDKVKARQSLARVFEARGMLEEATDLLVANVEAGAGTADTYRHLAHLYRQRGQEQLAVHAAAEAAKLLRDVAPTPILALRESLRNEAPPAQPVARTRDNGGWVILSMIGVIGLLVLATVLYGVVARPSPASGELSAAIDRPTVGSVAVPAVQPSTARSGEAKADLGTRPFDFGTNNQARELLALMEQQPGKASYNITYRTTADVVVVGFDLTTETLVRVHYEPGDLGYAEKWNGHALHRVRSAASGGSFNDTPTGKSFGTRTDF